MTVNNTDANVQQSKITPGQYRIIAGFLIFIILAGCALFTFGVFFIIEASASGNWPSVQGEVEGVYVRHTRGSSRTSQGSYHYEVTYSYLINDIIYTNDRYSLGSGSTASSRYSTEDEARSDAREAYPSGSEITVYYDPADPFSSVLDPGLNWGTFVPLLMGLVFIPTGIVFLVVIRRSYKNQGLTASFED